MGKLRSRITARSKKLSIILQHFVTKIFHYELFRNFCFSFDIEAFMKTFILPMLLLLPVSFAAAQDVDPDWAQAQIIFTGKLTKIVQGPTAKSFPPIWNHTLTFNVETVLRGEVKPGAEITAHHNARQEAQPQFAVNEPVIVALSKAREGLRVTILEPNTEALLDEVKVASLLPLGWSVKAGKAISPWAGLGKAAWPADMKDEKAKIVCSVTGRPALFANGIEFKVEKVPPKKDIKWTNPDGDGDYTITVTNPTDKPLVVPALLSADGKVLWDESLVIICQKKAYMIPGVQGVAKFGAGNVGPTTLEPKQSISTVVNVLRLDGPEWPQGGYRIEFQFCLGEKSSTQSFYYMSRHHDKLREAAKK